MYHKCSVLRNSIQSYFGVTIRKKSLTTIKENTVKSILEVNVPSTSVHEFLTDKLLKWQEKTGLECGISGRKYQNGNIVDLSHWFSASLQTKFKLVPGDCIATILPNLPEFPIVVLGASKAGLVTTTINPIYTPGEISQQLVHSNTKLIITTVAKYPDVSESVKSLKTEIPIVVIKENNHESYGKGCVHYEELVDKSLQGKYKEVNTESEDVFVLPYSSGTTGLPKGVQLTHRNIVANILQDTHPDISVTQLATSNFQEVINGVLPFYHIYGLTVICFSALATGSKIITLPRFDPKTYLSSLIHHKPSILYVAPPLLIFLGNNASVNGQHLSSVHTVITGAAPCGPSDIRKLKDKATREIFLGQGYGMTETSPVIMKISAVNGMKTASVGAPMPSTQVRVVDVDTNVNLPANKTGEIRVKGPQVMKGYLNNDGANRDIFDPDGYLKTGDIGYYDNDGDFYIVDRLKELIKVKGFQVAPAELEELLRKHPDVSDAAVVGVQHDRHGEVPVGFVVLKQEGQQDSVTEVQIQEFISRQVSSYKQLTGGVRFVQTIPKSPAGKILRKELRALLNR